LVESQRINGKPRQRTLAYLGSIRDRHLESPWARHWFWREVSRRLDALTLPKQERVRIEARLLAVVPRPSQEEQEAATQAFRRGEAALAKALGRPPAGRDSNGGETPRAATNGRGVGAR
jgi:hypothetical protein